MTSTSKYSQVGYHTIPVDFIISMVYEEDLLDSMVPYSYICRIEVSVEILRHARVPERLCFVLQFCIVNPFCFAHGE